MKSFRLAVLAVAVTMGGLDGCSSPPSSESNGGPDGAGGTLAPANPFVGTWTGTVEYSNQCVSGPCTTGPSPVRPVMASDTISVTFALSDTGELLMTAGADCSPIPFTQSNDGAKATATIEAGFGCSYSGYITYPTFTFTTTDGQKATMAQTRNQNTDPGQTATNLVVASWDGSLTKQPPMEDASAGAD